MNRLTINSILENRVLMHSLFWLSTLIIFPIYALSYNQGFLVAVVVKSFMLLVQIPASYYLLYYQFPQYLYKKRYQRFFISFLLSCLFFTTLLHLIEDFLMAYVMQGYNHDLHTFVEIIQNPFANIGYNGADVYFTVFMVAALKIIKQRLEAKRQVEVLEGEKTQAELQLLKAQVHPRILSKTLYQLHELTLQKSDAAPEVVITLSDMLDYMLYQCNMPRVLVRKEIALLQNYLDLEQLRHGADLKILFYHDLENEEVLISPLFLLSMVEGVFLNKEEDLPANARVEIYIKEAKSQLNIKVLSNLNGDKKNLEPTIRKQLDLLYPAQYQLAVEEEMDNFSLNLDIEIRA